MSDSLVKQAIEASQRAYVPYSEFPVGAVLRSTDGTLFTGCNVENAVYPVAICAERTALVKAVSEGHQAFDLIVIVTRSGGSPCGICRQMLYEFSPDMRVIMADLNGKIHHEAVLRDLLPLGFSPVDLQE